MSQEVFSGFYIVEQLGHKRLAGYVQEVTIAGTGFLRIDILGENGEAKATQFILPSTLYCLTPCSEEIARGMGKRTETKPYQVLELEYEKQQAQPIAASSQEQTLDTCDCGHAFGAHDDDGTCDFTTCQCQRFTQADGAALPDGADRQRRALVKKAYRAMTEDKSKRDHERDCSCPVCVPF